MDTNARTNAVAMDFRGVSKSYMWEGDNTNCIYYMTASQKPTSSSSDFGKTNNVIDGVAEKITLNANTVSMLLKLLRQKKSVSQRNLKMVE